MPPAHLVSSDDLQQILADALTSFSPLAALVGANSTRSLSNHTSNTKQLIATSLAPIGALGVMSTVCKGSKLNALKDLLGAGEADIFDACADLGCGSLYGVCPSFSTRGGMTCHGKNRNAGNRTVCAILRGEWRLAIDGPQGGGDLDFTELSQFLETINMSTISGRLVWKAKDPRALTDLTSCIRRKLLQSWDPRLEVWDTKNLNMLSSFQQSSVAEFLNASGTIELHWVSPAMPLETSSGIIYLFITVFTILPISVGIIAAIPSINWQSPASSALMLGGQAILGLGHFLAQAFLKRQRTSVYIEIPRHNFAPTWSLVDNVWFTGKLARRPLFSSPLSPDKVTIGQYVDIGPSLPTWQVLVTLLTIVIGFLAFYVGARSSNLWAIIIEIFLFFAANLFKGYIITKANDAYVTELNWPAHPRDNVVTPPPVKKENSLRRTISSVFHSLLRLEAGPLPTTARDADVEALKIPGKISPTDEKPPVLEPHDIPLPPSRTSSIAGSSPPPSLKSRKHASFSASALTREGSSVTAVTSSPTDTSTLTRKGSLPQSEKQQPCQQLKGDSKLVIPPIAPQNYRIYSKITSRRHDAIGLFYFYSHRAWGTAAHIIYEACHNQIQWAPHMKKEPILFFPFTFTEKNGKPSYLQIKEYSEEERKGNLVEEVNAYLILALDETLNEDIFWTTGQEFMSILVGAFTDTERLVTEYPEICEANIFGPFVYFTTRLILLAATASDNPPLEGEEDGGMYPGVASMMRAIDMVRRKYPLDLSYHVVPMMRAHARDAVQSVFET